MKQELQPYNTNQKSFYGKAKFIVNGNIISLFSYGSRIIDLEDGAVTYLAPENCFTATTLKHTKEFLAQFANLRNLKKKDILNLKK